MQIKKLEGVLFSREYHWSTKTEYLDIKLVGVDATFRVPDDLCRYVCDGVRFVRQSQVGLPVTLLVREGDFRNVEVRQVDANTIVFVYGLADAQGVYMSFDDVQLHRSRETGMRIALAISAGVSAAITCIIGLQGRSSK